MVKVSIVIPVKNSADLLEKCLASIRSLDFPMDDELEVVVVDGGSNDGSIEVAERFTCEVIVKYEDLIRLCRRLRCKNHVWSVHK